MSIEFRSDEETQRNGVRLIRKATLAAAALVDSPSYPAIRSRGAPEGRQRTEDSAMALNRAIAPFHHRRPRTPAVDISDGLEAGEYLCPAYRQRQTQTIVQVFCTRRPPLRRRSDDDYFPCASVGILPVRSWPGLSANMGPSVAIVAIDGRDRQGRLMAEPPRPSRNYRL